MIGMFRRYLDYLLTDFTTNIRLDYQKLLSVVLSPHHEISTES